MAGPWLKQSTAVTIKFGPFVDSGDGNTDETALTIKKADVRLSKNGGNMVACATDQGSGDAGAAHDEIGYYDISLGTGDTDTLGRLKVMVHKTGALHVWEEYMVVPANVWDSMFGADTLKCEVVEISGDTTAADNLEAACDNYSATRGLSGTALPDAAADGAGGLPISDAGGLDLDTYIKRLEAAWTAALAARIDENISAAKTLTADYNAAKTAAAAGAAMTLANDAIKAATFDESTAFPLKSADTGATILARAGDAMDLVDAPSATALIAAADAILARDIGSGSNALTAQEERTVRSALRFLRNYWEVVAGVLTVKCENDSTTAWTGAVTGTTGADPITTSNPT